MTTVSCAARAFGFSLVFESRSTDLYLDKFEWPNMRNKRGIFGDGGMYISVRSPKEMSFMAEELNGIPEWIDLSWRSPLVDLKSSKDFESQFANARRYVKRVYPTATVPSSAIDEVLSSRGKVLKLKFIFDDSTARVEYEVRKWR